MIIFAFSIAKITTYLYSSRREKKGLHLLIIQHVQGTMQVRFFINSVFTTTL